MNTTELLAVETSVLRTLCLTANSESSELKKRILTTLAEADFYFPITKSIFVTVCEMSSEGINVDRENLDKNLTRRSIDVPDDFFLEDLFAGQAPSHETLMGWLKGMSRNGEPVEAPPPPEHAPTAPAGTPIPPELAQTSPSVKPPPVDSTPNAVRLAPAPAAAPAPAPTEAPTSTEASAPAPKPKAIAKPKAEARPSEPEGPLDLQPSSEPNDELLTPESGEWLGYLAELTKKQGEHLKTGFNGIDAGFGGLGTGFLLLAGKDPTRTIDLLKQLVDQIAIRCRVPCMYLSFERSKQALRLQTLSRLSGAPAEHIKDGRFGKDSAEWQRIVRTGEQAVEWLQRIYVVEPKEKLPVTRIREMRESLNDSGAGAACLIAIDNLEKLSSESDLLQSVAELKELAESQGIVVIGAATSVELVHERSADMAITVPADATDFALDVLTPGAKPTKLQVHYRPETHRYEER